MLDFNFVFMMLWQAGHRFGSRERERATVSIQSCNSALQGTDAKGEMRCGY